ncbi:unnamed protein product, partial [Penicillium egyptiacum]
PTVDDRDQRIERLANQLLSHMLGIGADYADRLTMEDYKDLGLKGKSKTGRQFSLRGSSKRLRSDTGSPGPSSRKRAATQPAPPS